MSGINEVDIVFSTIARNYLHLAGFTILVYDHLLTLHVEVEHLWRRKKFGSAFWFFLNRYSSLLGNLASTILWMIPLNTNVSCRHFDTFRSVFASYSIVLVDLILFLRTYALYSRNRRLLIFLVTFGLAAIGITAWSQTVGNRDKPSGLSECVTWYSQHAAVTSRMMPWVSTMIYDIIIFSLTVHKTIHTAVSARCPDNNGRPPLTTIILRDGLMYFFMMILANAANVVTYIVANPYYKGIMTSFSCCVSSAMMSRLILNLHEGVPFPTISTDNRSSKASVVGIDRAPPTAPSSFLLSNDYPPTGPNASTDTSSYSHFQIPRLPTHPRTAGFLDSPTSPSSAMYRSASGSAPFSSPSISPISALSPSVPLIPSRSRHASPVDEGIAIFPTSPTSGHMREERVVRLSRVGSTFSDTCTASSPSTSSSGPSWLRPPSLSLRPRVPPSRHSRRLSQRAGGSISHPSSVLSRNEGLISRRSSFIGYAFAPPGTRPEENAEFSNSTFTDQSSVYDFSRTLDMLNSTRVRPVPRLLDI